MPLYLRELQGKRATLYQLGLFGYKRIEALTPDALAAYLASRVDPDPSRFPHADFEREPSAAEADAGRELVLDLDCRSCHVLDGEGEPVGPRLDGVARRLRPGYVYALVKDPEGVIPGTSMTNFGLDDEEARAITRFLQTLR